MKVRFIFHRGKDSALGKGIIAWTWLLALVRCDFKSLKHNFSHVEVWFPDENNRFMLIDTSGPEQIGQLRLPLGQCFSSTTRGDAEGVRFAPAAEVLHHSERWVYQEFEVDEKDVANLMPALNDIVGRGYDFAGIFGFFLPWNPQNENKEYCSEVCSFVAFWLRLMERIFRISPRRLAKVLGQPITELKGE